MNFIGAHTMDRSGRIWVRILLKLANLITALAGIAILLFSVWMTVVCLHDYHKYHLPWFLWACIGVGSIFCFTSCLGHAAAHTRNGCLLCLYIPAIFLLLLAEVLVTADVFLNDDWDKDFPKDPTQRFKDFVDFVEDYDKIFSFLAFLLLFSQGVSLILAMIMRTKRNYHNNRSLHEDIVSVHIPVTHPHVLGHPQYPPETNVLGKPLMENESYMQHPDKGFWPFAGVTAAYPQIHP